MKILLYGNKHKAEIRGAAVAQFGLARALRDRGHEVTFVQNAPPEERVYIDGVRQVYYDVRRKSVYPLLFGFRRVRSYDIIHANDEAGAYLALRHRVHRLPLVVQFNAPRIPPERFYRAHWRWRYIEIAARNAPVFQTPSQFTADTMIERFGIAPETIHAIPYGIGLQWFDAYRPGEGGGPLRVVLINMKGIDIALRALAKAAPAGEVTLELYGFDKQEAEHRAMARELGVADRVHFQGFVENHELPARIAQADLLIHPTDTESFGQVLGEAAALGLPALSTRASAVPEVVADGETGILCELDDIEAWAAGLRRFVEDAPLRRRMGQAARRRAEDLWRWERVVERMERELYLPLLSGPQSSAT